MHRKCLKCGEPLKHGSTGHSSGLCFLCRHKETLRIRGITDCTCYMCQRERGELKLKILEEESIEQTLEHRSREHVRLKQKWLKRKQRHPDQNIDVYKESDREFREMLKQIALVTTKPIITQQTLIIPEITTPSKDGLEEPSQPQDKPNSKLLRIEKI